MTFEKYYFVILEEPQATKDLAFFLPHLKALSDREEDV